MPLLRLILSIVTALYDFVAANLMIVLASVFGLVAVYLLLPKPNRRPVLLGGAAAGVALILAGVFVVRIGHLDSTQMYIEAVLFYIFSATAIIAAGLLITQANPARAALSFAIVVLASTGLFLIQAGPFLMAATIIVYAGAIIVTFLFVLMLAQQQGLSDADARSREPFLASMTGFLLLIALLYILKISTKPEMDRWVERTEKQLERVRAVLEMEERKIASGESKKALCRELGRFYLTYKYWLSNEPVPEDVAESKSDNVRVIKKSPPPGTEALVESLDNFGGLVPDRKREDLMANIGQKRDGGPSQLQQIEQALVRLVDAGQAARNDPGLGSLRPVGAGRMSELSGPSSSRPLKELRRDDEGRPHLPAENTMYLGRSLFSDYLLPVELAGTLLLVATIGAIAITQRKNLETPGSAASTNGTVPRRNA